MLKLNPVRFYNLLNIKHPTATQVLTTAALMATGDVLSQKFVEKREHINVQRTGRFFFVGCVYVGPVLRTWYPRLEQLISHSAKMRALKMASIDQLVFTPVFLPGFLITLSTFQGKNIGHQLQLRSSSISGSIRKHYSAILEYLPRLESQPRPYAYFG
ncbi:protein Mpv17-like isoform X2 [Varroa destructor]|uniref:Mitochondrial inner membrane protein Mpv17 n=1 Tax=Varroa destructor TaxID=109461 RepID=A0A7M7K9K2_VARDE|nr:protein Mpv17-like isoform X2 [Varroa destructor]